MKKTETTFTRAGYMNRPVETTGEIFDVWGICKAAVGKGWDVVHVPSGILLTGNHAKTKARAIASDFAKSFEGVGGTALFGEFAGITTEKARAMRDALELHDAKPGR